MENASKALLIAGGVLITIIIVSVFVFMYDQLKSIPKTQEEVKVAEQLAEFNKKYESYNKKNLYGADVISVINMARNNNNTHSNDNEYQIEIEVTITSDIESRTRMWYYDTSERDSSKAVKEAGSSWGYPKNIDIIQKNITTPYNLSSNIWDKILKHTTGNSNSEYIYSDSNGIPLTPNKLNWDLYKETHSGTTYKVYYMSSNLAYEFKNRKFDCTKIEYGANGRVNKLAFKQK